MKKLLTLCALFSLSFAGGNEVFTGGVKPSGEIVLDKEYEKSAKLFKESCEKGHMYNCYNIANFYKDGLGVIKSEINALKYYQISCDGKLPYGCFMVAEFAYKNANVAKAIENYSLACDLGDDKGCLKLAEFYYVGEGVDKNLEKAKNLSEKACQMGNDRGCKAYENLSKNN